MVEPDIDIPDAPQGPGPGHAPRPAPAPAPHPESTQETVKETFESIIIAFVLAFVFRAYVVEAFVIPTGSMAPTLLGTHLDVSCEQCGYRFSTDVPRHSHNRDALGQVTQVVCPMCRYPNVLEAQTTAASGDRILVQKYVYQLTEPRRFDVVVFKAPHDPQRNFIKRLIGLPNESLYLFEGNVYTRPAGSDQPWQIARKSRRPDVQRAVWQPIYDSRYIPRDGGSGTLARQRHPWQVPWVPTSHPERWQIAGRRSYQYAAEAPGRIAFRFDRLGYRAQPPDSRGGVMLKGRYPYNQFKPYPMDWEPIEDIRLAAVFQPDEAGLSVKLSTTARLDRDAVETLTAGIDAQGTVTLTATGPDGRTRELARSAIAPFAAEQNRRVELWYVDHEASVWVEGERVLRKRFDLPLERLRQRRPAPPVPELSIAVAGSPVALHKVQLDRDLYYSTRNPTEGRIARGALRRDGPRNQRPLRLEADEFFCIGDNTPWSHDSRYWQDVDDWVAQRFFVGHHRPGIVPRELMMGRAFFVYYPAPYSWQPAAPKVFPNFGDMRFIE